MSDRPLPGVFQLTPLNPDFSADPHKLLDRLRSASPVHRDTQAGTFILTRHADVRGVLSDTTMWRGPERAEEAALIQRALVEQRIEGMEIPEDELRSGILLMDEPDHMRIRAPFAKALYKRVAKARPLVEGVVEQWLAPLRREPSFDAMDRFALRVPIDVIARILGVDESRLVQFREWSEGAILGLNPFRSEEETKTFVRSANALSVYMGELMEERAKAPRDDLVSDMMQLKDEGAPLSRGEISNNLQGLLIGGNLTTTDLIGNAIFLFLTHPGELAKLRADPQLINSAVEEVLRYESPVDITGRIAPRDMEVGGCPVKQRQSLFASLRAANRDPQAFPDPHRFDISRKDAPHVAFGGGLHLCIGAPLARLEAQVALARFFEAFPGARLADPSAPPAWRAMPFFRGLKELCVAV
ncbi:MAG TPA: cytochrome P450 [Rhizomicrobium sp.]|jgi:cytochrome P450|nr:cytochrome P450 [Rhizomicrobium sp.]